MKKIIIFCFTILGLSSIAQAKPIWYMTCQITEINETSKVSYNISANDSSSRLTTGLQSTRMASPLSFEAFMKEKTVADTLTPWMKVGDRQVVINVWQNNIPLSNVVGKEDALVITRFGGKKLTIGCYTFKK